MTPGEWIHAARKTKGWNQKTLGELLGVSQAQVSQWEWRRGLVWHTQGSGKSLTILFAARKLWHHPDLQQPTILIVIDRDQLQDQMIGQFIRTNTETCRVAESKAALVALLGDGDGFRGIIVTIMHKFAGHERVAVPRRNVVALVDEAHRSQEGEFGKWMRAALPEASLFGFTGTPIENDDHNTPLAFGRILGQNDKGEELIERYMQPGGRYSIADAIRDGATQPIHYEPRVGDWAVWGEKLDFVFEREFSHLPEGEREQLRREGARLEVILKLPKRIRMIAEDMAKDFTERVRPNRFKAMLVCYDKETGALVDHEGDYLWLSRLWIYYAKEFYPKAQRFETDPADSAKTRELIRQHVDVEELKRNLPSYTLDADYLTKLKDRPPDSKALNIEAMLASELSIRASEDPEFEPLSERLKHIVQAKRNGTVAGLALLSELEQLTRETVALIQESRRPLAETLADAAKERSPGLEPELAGQIAAAIVAKADEPLFPGWLDQQEHIDTEIFREFTKLLAKEFPAAGLHRRDQDFVDRCIKMLRRANYRARTDG